MVVERARLGAILSASDESPAAIAVIIPVHNEAALIGSCLTSVAAAIARVDAPVVVIPVLDRCSDASARVVHEFATQHPGVLVRCMHDEFAGVGEVRDAGVRSAARAWPAIPAERVWTAHTDADTRVPSEWLSRQWELAATGIDLVVGTVVPDEPAHTSVAALWWSQHQLGEGHPAIHGANLGIRLSCLLTVGGFGRRRIDEDVAAVQRIRAAGYAWVATDSTRVLTSSRRRSNIEGGFATFMRNLDEDVRDGGTSAGRPAGESES